ncbi:MAG: PIN domain-containing protein [Candidatus Bathyarchaeia archaeon]
MPPILIETDILLALISAGDRHHADAIRLLDEAAGDAMLSPYSIMELDLLLRAGEIIVKDIPAFYEALGEALEYRGIGAFPIKLAYHREAFRLRGEHKGLTYFDSLHAAVGIVEDIELVSYDRIYASVAGLRYGHPDAWLR